MKIDMIAPAPEWPAWKDDGGRTVSRGIKQKRGKERGVGRGRNDITVKTSRDDSEGERLVKRFLAGPPPLFGEKNGWITAEDFPSAVEREKMIGFLRRESCMLRELMDNPGTYRMPECIYGGEAKGWVDSYLSRSPGGRALHNRIRAVIDGAEKLVLEKMRGDHGRAHIINLGSGTGRDTVEMAKKNSRWNGNVHIECVDLDREALDAGREFARAAGAASVDFVEANILSPHREEFDVGLLIGVLCGIPTPRCVAILKKIRPCFKKGGVLIASNVTTTMIGEDPFTSFILDEFVGWRLVYKTPGQLRNIFERAGYEWRGCFYDEPHRFHCMGMGVVK